MHTQTGPNQARRHRTKPHEARCLSHADASYPRPASSYPGEEPRKNPNPVHARPEQITQVRSIYQRAPPPRTPIRTTQPQNTPPSPKKCTLAHEAGGQIQRHTSKRRHRRHRQQNPTQHQRPAPQAENPATNPHPPKPRPETTPPAPKPRTPATQPRTSDPKPRATVPKSIPQVIKTCTIHNQDLLPKREPPA